MEPSETALVQRPNGQGQDVLRVAGAPPPENYVNGFEGMATEPFAKEIVAILRAPIPEQDVEIKPDGIVYLPGVFYRQRLFDAFGPGGWAIAPRSPAKRAPAAGGECVMYHGALWCHGRYVSEAVGQCVYYPGNAGMQYADAFEGAKTDAITRCCKDLGIARELWDPTWRAQWQAKYAHQVKRNVRKWNKQKQQQEWVETMVWERKGREQKLGVPTAGAGGAASASGLSTAPAATPPAAAAATEDQITDVELADLEGLLREMKWKRQFTRWWFMGRFGVPHNQITREQHRSACRLLLAWAAGGEDAEAYKRELASEVAAGRCKP